MRIASFKLQRCSCVIHSVLFLLGSLPSNLRPGGVGMLFDVIDAWECGIIVHVHCLFLLELLFWEWNDHVHFVP